MLVIFPLLVFFPQLLTNAEYVLFVNLLMPPRCAISIGQELRT